MAETTGIKWTDHTWSPWWGCTRVSEGCRNCFAADISERYHDAKWGHNEPRIRRKESTWHNPIKWNAQAQKSGVRRRVFCGSMCDIFDTEVPIEWLRDALEVMRKTPWLSWQLLTKRPAAVMSRLREVGLCISSNTDDFVKFIDLVGMIGCWMHGDAPENIWVGTSVENQAMADLRIPILLRTPAVVRFLSVEPLLGPVELGLAGVLPKVDHPGYVMCYEKLHWVIIGAESGPNYRPMELSWLTSIVKECQDAHVPVFVKQDAALKSGQQGRIPDDIWQIKEFPYDAKIVEPELTLL